MGVRDAVRALTEVTWPPCKAGLSPTPQGDVGRAGLCTQAGRSFPAPETPQNASIRTPAIEVAGKVEWSRCAGAVAGEGDPPNPSSPVLRGTALKLAQPQPRRAAARMGLWAPPPLFVLQVLV